MPTLVDGSAVVAAVGILAQVVGDVVQVHGVRDKVRESDLGVPGYIDQPGPRVHEVQTRPYSMRSRGSGGLR